MAQVVLKRLKCYEQEDWTFDDDIELIVGGRAVWRNAMDTGQTRSIGQTIDFTGSVAIKMLEKDWEGDDHLGTYTVFENHSGAFEREAKFTLDGADYSLWYTVTTAATNVDDRTDEWDDFLDPYIPWTPAPGGDKPPTDPVEPCPFGGLAVTVTEPDGFPVPDATVVVRELSLFGVTDQEGKVLFDPVIAGWLTVEARKDTFGPDPASKRVIAVSDATVPVGLHLSRGEDCQIIIPDLAATHYAVDRAHFTLSASDYKLHISSDIDFVKGWAASVVKLGNHVPAGTGGLLDGKLTWNGYRWMKQSGVNQVYWDGSAWQPIPAAALPLQDADNFCVGFYKIAGAGTGGADVFRCQYGGDWPEQFTDWDLTAAPKQQVLRDWEAEIAAKWTGKFNIRRKECPSIDPSHCRYETIASARFIEKVTFAAKMLIVADGNIRANDSLFFMGQRAGVSAHEFGHHLGNPDEYAGAKVDTSLNDDGAVNGIDATSVMGQSMVTVKKRHYRTVCKHLAAMVKTQSGLTSTYEAVPP